MIGVTQEAAATGYNCHELFMVAKQMTMKFAIAIVACLTKLPLTASIRAIALP